MIRTRKLPSGFRAPEIFLMPPVPAVRFDAFHDTLINGTRERFGVAAEAAGGGGVAVPEPDPAGVDDAVVGGAGGVAPGVLNRENFALRRPACLPKARPTSLMAGFTDSMSAKLANALAYPETNWRSTSS